MAVPSTSTRKPRSRATRWSLSILFAVLGVGALAAVGVWITLSFGGVSGIELCPQTFERRSFDYYEVPLVGWQVTKVTRITLTGDTEKHLVKNKLLPTSPGGKTTWHIVRAQRGRRSWTGDAGILVNYFEAEDSAGNPIWLEWTTANPQLAAVLWPAISQLAVDGLYVYVPEVIALAAPAQDAQDAGTFPAQLDQQLATAYHAAAMSCQKAGNHEAAVEYFDQALRYAPNNQEYRQARDASKTALTGGLKAEAEPE